MWLGFRLSKIPVIRIDSSAAKGVATRQRVGSIRHLSLRTLWLHNLVKARAFEMRKVAGTTKAADMGTKSHHRGRHRALCQLCHLMDKDQFLNMRPADVNMLICESLRELHDEPLNQTMTYTT